MEDNKNKKRPYYSELSPEILSYNIIYHLENKHGITDEKAQKTIKSIIFNFVKKEEE